MTGSEQLVDLATHMFVHTVWFIFFFSFSSLYVYRVKINKQNRFSTNNVTTNRDQVFCHIFHSCLSILLSFLRLLLLLTPYLNRPESWGFALTERGFYFESTQQVVVNWKCEKLVKRGRRCCCSTNIFLFFSFIASAQGHNHAPVLFLPITGN